MFKILQVTLQILGKKKIIFCKYSLLFYHKIHQKLD